MILFKEVHVQPILEGRKTQTRRLWKTQRVYPGRVYQARTKMLDAKSTFARLRVKRVWEELLGNISEDNAHTEGYSSRDDYIAAFARINKLKIIEAVFRFVWVVEFEVVEESSG